MKKLILLSLLCIGCQEAEVTPIEKFKPYKCVITNMAPVFLKDYRDIQLKNKDTIFWITVLNFDAKNLKIGDTIK